MRMCGFDPVALCVPHFVSVHVVFQNALLLSDSFPVIAHLLADRYITSLDVTGGKTLQEESASGPGPQP